MQNGRTTDQEAGLERSRYFEEHYFSPEQWLSFCAQVDAVRRLSPRSVVEVGLGNGIVSLVLRHMGIQVTTVDINPALEPDLVASITDLAAAVPPDSCDVVLCAEVMEHLPYELFSQCLENLASVTKDRVLITLPDVLRRSLTLRGGLWKARLNVYWGTHDHRVPPYHHWHIGSERRTRLPEVLAEMGRHFVVEKHSRILGNPIHRLFVLRKVPHSEA